MAGMKSWFVGVWKELKDLSSSFKATLPYFLGLTEHHKEVTEEYPDRVSARMPEDLPPRFRGLLNNNIAKCTGCRVCSDVCPIDCIRIETEPGPKKGEHWEIGRAHV